MSSFSKIQIQTPFTENVGACPCLHVFSLRHLKHYFALKHGSCFASLLLFFHGARDFSTSWVTSCCQCWSNVLCFHLINCLPTSLEVGAELAWQCTWPSKGAEITRKEWRIVYLAASFSWSTTYYWFGAAFFISYLLLILLVQVGPFTRATSTRLRGTWHWKLTFLFFKIHKWGFPSLLLLFQNEIIPSLIQFMWTVSLL